MSNIDNNKQDNTDVIRAQDILPPYNQEKYREHSLKETAPSLSTSQPQHPETGATEIPKFDLAEQIMAEQRKITAIRRKAPGQKTKTSDRQTRIQSTGCAIKQPAPALPEKGLIIAEIVARDIEKLYRGDSSSFRNW
ncbi:MAG: hypothetical protein H8D56_16910 [Planctomycetes bacterium]|nr:hypothetical protein [Planctomycetota bacterium]MBL7146821.1 hypothetical protein [Phycisphaerae bacterium]